MAGEPLGHPGSATGHLDQPAAAADRSPDQQAERQFSRPGPAAGGVLGGGRAGYRDQHELGGDLVVEPVLDVDQPRLLPLLSTHLSFPQIAEEMSLSRHTIKSQVMSIYRKLGTPPSARPSPGPVSSVSWRDDSRSSSHQGDGIRSGMRCHGAVTVGEPSGSDGEIPGDSALAGDEHEGFVEGQAGFGHDPAGPSALDPRAAALLRVGTCVATWSPGVRLESSTGRALAAGSAEDEIANALLAITQVAGLGPVVVAAPDVATALGYDITAALEEPDGH